MLEIIRTIPIEHYVIYSSILFAIGVFGVLVRRNAIVVLMCIELMLNAVNLLLAAFSTSLRCSGSNNGVFYHGGCCR